MTLKLRLQTQWKLGSSREQQMVVAAAVVVLCATLWWLGLAPALQILRNAESHHKTLDAQLQIMLNLQNQAQQLKSQSKINYQDATRELEIATARNLGAAAQLQITGERATITLKKVPAEALTTWLHQIRANARATPSEAQLTRTTETNLPTPAMAKQNSPLRLTATQNVNLGAPPQSPPANTATEVQWSGTLVLRLPSSH